MERESKVCYYDSTAFHVSNGANRHYHGLMEFYFLETGTCTYLIDDKLFEVQAGDLVIIPQGVIHKTSYEGEHFRLLINCSEDFFAGLPRISDYVYRNAEIREEIRAVFKAVEAEYLHSDAFSAALTEGYLHRLMALICRNPNRYHGGRPANPYVEETLNRLHRQYAGEISLTKIAESCGISPEHLSRLFKKETGLNFGEYLSQLRLKAAESMLRQGTLSVAEVAFACGFNDSNYFSGKFKQAYGVSPLAFKKQAHPESR